MPSPSPNANVPQISQPVAELGALVMVAQSVKQGVDSLAGRRGKPTDRAVTFNDLLALKLLVEQGGDVAVNTAIEVSKYAVTVGDGAATSFVIAHNLHTQDVQVQVHQAATPFTMLACTTSATSVDTATVVFAVAPATGSARVVVFG